VSWPRLPAASVSGRLAAIRAVPLSFSVPLAGSEVTMTLSRLLAGTSIRSVNAKSPAAKRLGRAHNDVYGLADRSRSVIDGWSR